MPPEPQAPARFSSVLGAAKRYVLPASLVALATTWGFVAYAPQATAKTLHHGPATSASSSPPNNSTYFPSGVGISSTKAISPPVPSGSSAGAGYFKVTKNLVASGKQLFTQACSSCHGITGQGTYRGPSLLPVGPAAIDFWLTTGRMPAAHFQLESPQKPPRFSAIQIKALVSYYSTFGSATPSIPTVNLTHASVSKGARLFLADCSSCHTAAGAGAALSYGAFAPSLKGVTPLMVGEAMRTGPMDMPKFGPKSISNTEMNDIIRYVMYLQHPASPGGLNLGKTGPTAEDFVGLVLGLGSLILFSYYIGDRA
ncbi:MAG: cytochrome bc1 complex diheme cytochrome c subunit [Acidimicrobiales bacterium]